MKFDGMLVNRTEMAGPCWACTVVLLQCSHVEHVPLCMGQLNQGSTWARAPVPLTFPPLIDKHVKGVDQAILILLLPDKRWNSGVSRTVIG